MKNKLPIRLDEIYSHWKKLCFEEDAVAEEVADDYACLAEWHAIQERLRRSDVSVKNDIRNQLRLIAFPETTNLQAPIEDAKSKGAKKKKRVRGTTREKSCFEHVDKRVADSQSFQSKPSSSQKKPSSSQAKPPVSTKFSTKGPIELDATLTRSVEAILASCVGPQDPNYVHI
ncbi:hypothetical protein P8452_56090 [Trifolium repens]|nr:hypothetical protein P8452_56090 [Trifolium repens]